MREPLEDQERLAHRPDPALSAACFAGRVRRTASAGKPPDLLAPRRPGGGARGNYGLRIQNLEFVNAHANSKFVVGGWLFRR
jgi:hypothetical protein